LPIFNINYIILKFFYFEIFQITKFCEGKYWICKNILFVEMKILHFVNYFGILWYSKIS
jgi:hypothetical protein